MATVLTKKLLQFEGIPEIVSRVDRMLLRLKEDGSTVTALKKVYMKGGLLVRDEARDLAPEVSGRFKRSLFGDYGPISKPNIIIGANFKIAPHAWLVEFGSSRTRPHHAMRDAITATRPLVARIIKEGLQDAIPKAIE